MNKHIKIIVLFLAAASSCAEPMKRKRDGDKGDTGNSTTVSFRCTFPGCNQSFGKKSELDKHVKTHQLQTHTSLPASNQEEQDRPAKKQKTGTQASSEKSQTAQTTSDSVFKCTYPQCKLVFSKQPQLLHHYKTHNRPGDERFYCPYCKFSSTVLGNITTHIKDKCQHKPKDNNVTVAQSKTGKTTKEIEKRTANAQTMQSNTETKDFYKCHFEGCGQEFSAANHHYYKLHIRKHTGEKPFKCPADGCNEAFPNPNKLVTHFQTHTDREDVFTCPYCDQTYKESKHVTTHMKTKHPDKNVTSPEVEGDQQEDIVDQPAEPAEKQTTKEIEKHPVNTQSVQPKTRTKDHYICPFEGCGKKFTAHAHNRYKMHINKHTGVNPFKCTADGCEETFPNPTQLVKHYQSHTQTQDFFTCPHCDYKNRLAKDTTTHMKNRHPDKNVTSPEVEGDQQEDTVDQTPKPAKKQKKSDAEPTAKKKKTTTKKNKTSQLPAEVETEIAHQNNTGNADLQATLQEPVHMYHQSHTIPVQSGIGHHQYYVAPEANFQNNPYSIPPQQFIWQNPQQMLVYQTPQYPIYKEIPAPEQPSKAQIGVWKIPSPKQIEQESPSVFFNKDTTPQHKEHTIVELPSKKGTEKPENDVKAIETNVTPAIPNQPVAAAQTDNNKAQEKETHQDASLRLSDSNSIPVALLFSKNELSLGLSDSGSIPKDLNFLSKSEQDEAQKVSLRRSAQEKNKPMETSNPLFTFNSDDEDSYEIFGKGEVIQPEDLYQQNTIRETVNNNQPAYAQENASVVIPPVPETHMYTDDVNMDFYDDLFENKSSLSISQPNSMRKSQRKSETSVVKQQEQVKPMHAEQSTVPTRPAELIEEKQQGLPEPILEVPTTAPTQAAIIINEKQQEHPKTTLEIPSMAPVQKETNIDNALSAPVAQMSNEEKMETVPEINEPLRSQNNSPNSTQGDKQEESFSCTFENCGEVFTRNFHLQNHSKLHNDERRYKCKKCIYSNDSRHGLLKHKRVHNNGLDNENDSDLSPKREEILHVDQTTTNATDVPVANAPALQEQASENQTPERVQPLENAMIPVAENSGSSNTTQEPQIKTPAIQIADIPVDLPADNASVADNGPAIVIPQAKRLRTQQSSQDVNEYIYYLASFSDAAGKSAHIGNRESGVWKKRHRDISHEDSSSQSDQSKRQKISHVNEINDNAHRLLKDRPFKCSFPSCRSSFAFKKSLDLHMKSHSDEECFVCPHADCGQSFKSLEALDYHLGNHMQTTNYEAQAITDASSEISHGPGTDYSSIPESDYNYMPFDMPEYTDYGLNENGNPSLEPHNDSDSSQVIPHEKGDHSESIHDDDEEDDDVLIVASKQKDQYPLVKKYLCSEKGCTFKTAFNRVLQVHLKRTHKKTTSTTKPQKPSASPFPVKKYKCDHPNCSYSADQQHHLNAHKKMHDTNTPYSCPKAGCSRKFREKSHLNVHLKWHNDRAIHVCTHDGCTEKFESKRDLDEHLKTHTDDKKFKCTHEKCTEKFKSKRELNDHLKTHTDDKKFKCTFKGCNKTYARKGDLTRHQKTHKGSEPDDETYEEET